MDMEGGRISLYVHVKYIYIYLSIHTYLYITMCVYICMYVCIFLYLYTYMQTYTAITRSHSPEDGRCSCKDGTVRHRWVDT